MMKKRLDRKKNIRAEIHKLIEQNEYIEMQNRTIEEKVEYVKNKQNGKKKKFLPFKEGMKLLMEKKRLRKENRQKRQILKK